MGTPMIYCVETTAGAERLFNAVVSTGTEVTAQHISVVPSMTHEHAAACVLQQDLRWLAEGPKVSWPKVIAAARRAVKKFLRAQRRALSRPATEPVHYSDDFDNAVHDDVINVDMPT